MFPLSAHVHSIFAECFRIPSRLARKVSWELGAGEGSAIIFSLKIEVVAVEVDSSAPKPTGVAGIGGNRFGGPSGFREIRRKERPPVSTQLKGTSNDKDAVVLMLELWHRVCNRSSCEVSPSSLYTSFSPVAHSSLKLRAGCPGVAFTRRAQALASTVERKFAWGNGPGSPEALMHP